MLYIACIALWCFSSIFTIVHLVRSSIWVPVNDLTINYVVPYSFKLRGKVFRINGVVNEWLDQTIQGVLKKRYCVVVNNSLTCQISYDMLTKSGSSIRSMTDIKFRVTINTGGSAASDFFGFNSVFVMLQNKQKEIMVVMPGSLIRQ